MIDMLTESESAAADTSPLALQDVAGGLFALILAAAAIMRFTALGAIPLSPGEAEAALANWTLWQPDPGSYQVLNPAYFSFTSLLTPILGYSDAVMRLLPALFGMGTVALAWLLRRQLGLIGALLLALFLAISPLNSVAARTVGGDSIAQFSLMLLLTAWIRYRQEGESRWLNFGAVALGLGLASSPLFYGGTLSLAVAGLIQRWLGPRWSESRVSVWPEAAAWRRVAMVGGLVFAMASTFFLWHPAGFGSAVALPVQWLSQLRLPGDVAQLLNPLLAAGRYELMLLFPGTAALIWAVRQEKTMEVFCVYWMGAIVGLILLQEGQVNNALLLTMPGYLLLASFANDILVPKIHRVALMLAAGLFLAEALIIVNLARYSRIVVYQPEQMANIWIALLVFATSLVAIYYLATYVASWNFRILGQGILISTFILLSVYYWGTSWWLSQQGANDPRGRWGSLASDDEVSVLQEVVKDISRQVTGSDHGLEILNAVDSPVLRWYLREFKNLENRGMLPADTRSPLLISWAGSEPVLENEYVGAEFGIIRTGLEPLANPSNTPVLDTFRWWFFHDSAQSISEQRVIVWWRADLAQR